MRTLLHVALLLTASMTAFAQATDAAKPLAAFVGHWEGGGTFVETPMSPAGKVASKTDCSWSTQGHYLVCEQTLTDDKGTHQQLTIYTPSDDGGDFTYYTMTGSAAPFTGKVKIESNVWTYDNSFEQDGKKTEVRTTNTFSGDDETFKTEFRIADGAWTTMLDGKSHRAKK
ncbi:hypothetical protein Acid345_0337 [Candidatus Koribacter versatilis Ellin345]|uniref:DUF1579 domain-containing protein n=1 Tax=Koribacter versatilis (strain Ellin345) TaxID=204669 RepID=Q1IUV8_KORVE|nr:DUF1579 family protein [Candidatus Koribacter versatilis]ABF39342.1 hypothetical protein Acid345_0337 [Candidatus Koribacter versatilis Ellin345]